MFSGIVEALTPIVKIETEQGNKHFTLRNPFKDGTTIDQSIAHNGVCLTVVKTNDQMVNGKMVLDLSGVRESAHVYVNGHDAGKCVHRYGYAGNT